MRRVYGYKKLHHAGRRYQDGVDAQARSDKPVVITKTAFPSSTAVAEEVEEIIDVKPVAPVVQEEPPKKVQALVDDGNDETGPLPKELTGFMPGVQGDVTADTEPVKVTTDESGDDSE